MENKERVYLLGFSEKNQQLEIRPARDTSFACGIIVLGIFEQETKAFALCKYLYQHFKFNKETPVELSEVRKCLDQALVLLFNFNQ